jgi:predicted PurR-regulated permease PerM
MNGIYLKLYKKNVPTKNKMKQINNYIKYALILILLFLSYLILKPFLTIIILSLAIAYMTFPLQKRFRKYLNENITAGLLTLALLLIILIPIIILGNALLTETTKLYVSTNQETFQTLLEKINITLSPEIQSHLNEITKTATSYLMSGLASFIFSIPNLIINFFIAIVIIFFTLRDGDKVINKILEIFPIEETYKQKFIKRITTTLESLFYGIISLSLIEGFVALIGFYLLGIKSPLILALAIIMTAILPGIGATVVWIPLTIFALIQGNITQAILIALFGSIILSTLIDTFLRAKILGMRANIHPLIVIIGVIGGLAAFGPTGIIIGPLVLSLLELAIEIYRETKHEY